MTITITEEPIDTIASKIIPLSLLADGWRDPKTFRDRFLDRFRKNLKRAAPDMPMQIEVAEWSAPETEPSIVLLARPRGADPLE